MSAAAMSKGFWHNFLTAYISMPCLWQMRSPDYSNRQKRNQCYRILSEMCQEVDPEANREYVLKKINSFRTTFRKEYRKVLESKRSKSGKTHVPSLWYYNILLPTVQQNLEHQAPQDEAELEAMQETAPTEMHSSDEEWEIDVKDEDEEDEIELYSDQVVQNGGLPPAEQPLALEASSANKPPSSPLSVQSCRSDEDFVISAFSDTDRGRPQKRKASGSPQCHQQSQHHGCHQCHHEPEDEFDPVGKMVAAKLRLMSCGGNFQHVIAERLIADVLYHGQMNALTTETYLTRTAP